MSSSAILWFDKVGIADVADVGGKNAHLPLMRSARPEAQTRSPGKAATRLTKGTLAGR